MAKNNPLVSNKRGGCILSKDARKMNVLGNFFLRDTQYAYNPGFGQRACRRR
jgi:hypothetical protein